MQQAGTAPPMWVLQPTGEDRYRVTIMSGTEEGFRGWVKGTCNLAVLGGRGACPSGSDC